MRSIRWAALGAAMFQILGLAQQASRLPLGHFQGNLQMRMGGQTATVLIVADLSKDQAGEWIGTCGMPEMGINDVPLSKIVVDAAGVRFLMAGLPYSPSFDGRLSADGKALTGAFLSGGGKYPLSMQRTGEAKIRAPLTSTSLSKEFEGLWHGSLETGGAAVTLELKLERTANGNATGTVSNPDQPGKSLPVAVAQKDKSLRLEIRTMGVTYSGTLNAAGAGITGDWTMLGKTSPVTFVRGAAPSTNTPLSKNFEGTWQGLIDAGGDLTQLKLVLKLSRAADGTATGTLATGDQGAKVVPLSNITQKDKTLQFEVKAVPATFHGTINAAGDAIAGEWMSLDKLPLVFKRVSSSTR